MRIDTKPVAVVLLRVLSIYLVAQGLEHSTRLLSMPNFWAEADMQNKLLVLTTFLTPLVIGVLLWLFSKKIALWVSQEAQECWLPEEKSLVAAGTFIIGVYWAMTSFSAFLAIYNSGGLKRASYAWLIVLGISILLILGSNFVSRAYFWLRTFGSSHNKSSNTDAGAG